MGKYRFLAVTFAILLAGFSATVWKNQRGPNGVEQLKGSLYLSKAGMLPDASFVPFTRIKNLRSRNIFYNRIEKCASRSMISVVTTLTKINNFTILPKSTYDIQSIEVERRNLLEQKPPTFYKRHLYYVDFEGINYNVPIYINMIRDPIQRFASLYNYRKYGDNTSSSLQRYSKGPSKKTDINDCVEKGVGLCDRKSEMMFKIGRYFCGWDDVCKESTSRKRVEIAKRNIDTYTFIGAAEEFETSLILLEKMLPEYFTGALDAWQKNTSKRNSTATRKKDVLTENSIQKLRGFMQHEYEVYNYAMQKFEYLKNQFGIS